MQGIAQKWDSSVNPDDFFRAGYFAPKPEFNDTIQKLITNNQLIDSTTIEYVTFYNLDVVRKYNSNLHSEDFCFFIDSVYLDSIPISKVKRRLVSGSVGYADEYYQLIRPIRLSLDYFYYGYTSLILLQEPKIHAKKLFSQYESDRLSDFSFQELKKDELGRIWVKVSFHCSRTEADVSLDAPSDFNKPNFDVTGWTRLNLLQIGYDCF